MTTLSKSSFVFALIGLAFSWVFFPPVLMTGFFPENRAYTLANETLLAFCSLLFIVAAALCKPLESFVRSHRGGLVGIVLLGLVGYGLLIFALSAGYSMALALTATFLLALSYSGLMIGWTVLLGLIEGRQTTLLLFGSALIYAVITLGNFFPTQGRMALCGSSAALSGLCWLAASRNNFSDWQSVPFTYDFRNLRHGPFLMLGLLAVLLIGGRVVTGLYFNLDKELSLIEMIVRGLSIACVMLYCILETRRGASLAQEYRSAWIPAAALFLLGSMVLIGMPGPATPIGLGITHGAINCFEVLAYLVMFQFVRNDRVSSVMVVSLGMLLFKILPIALQRLIFPHIINVLGLSEADFVPVVILMAMAALVCVLAFSSHRVAAEEMKALASADVEEASESGDNNTTATMFAKVHHGQNIDRAASSVEPDVPSPFTLACHRLAQERGLSAREEEIMELIARGNSQRYISETLYLALGTVQWYAKIIYRKLDVHSKQELINLVANQGEPK